MHQSVRLFFFIGVWFIITNQPLRADEFKIKAVFRDQTDLSALRRERFDDNDQRCAIVKVLTDMEGLSFECSQNFIGDPDLSVPGEIWLYISPREKRITIRKGGYLPEICHLPEPAESGAVYKIALTSDLSSQLSRGRGTLLLRSFPDSATIEIGGLPDFVKNTPFIFRNYEARAYQFRIYRHRYQVLDTVLKIEDRKSLEAFVRLRPLWGALIVNVEPPDAAISLDGKVKSYGSSRWITPDNAPDTGVYHLEVSKPGYYSWHSPITIAPDSTVELSIVLQPVIGWVQLTSDPPDATVVIDQKVVGSTPLLYQAMIGSHQLTLSREGYVTHESSIEIVENDTLTVYKQLVSSVDIQIITEPSSAWITLNGVPVGKSPLRCKARPGANQLVLQKEGYESFEGNFTVNQYQSDYEFTMLPVKRNVRITSSPPGLWVQCNDGQSGQTPTTFLLRRGSYQLTFSGSRYTTRHTTIAVRNSDKTVFRRLRPSGLGLYGYSWSKGFYGGNVTFWGSNVEFIIDLQGGKPQDIAHDEENGLQLSMALGYRINLPYPMAFHAGGGLRTFTNPEADQTRTIYSPVAGVTLPVFFNAGRFMLYGQVNHWFKTETVPMWVFTVGIGGKF